jgi:hypothetical protein
MRYIVATISKRDEYAHKSTCTLTLTVTMGKKKRKEKTLICAVGAKRKEGKCWLSYQ